MIKKTALLTFFAFSSICAGGDASDYTSLKAELERSKNLTTQMKIRAAGIKNLIAETDHEETRATLITCHTELEKCIVDSESLNTQQENLIAHGESLNLQQEKLNALFNSEEATEVALTHRDFNKLKALFPSPLHLQECIDGVSRSIIYYFATDNSQSDNIVSVLEFLLDNGIDLFQFHCWNNEHMVYKILIRAFEQNKKQLCYNLLNCLCNNAGQIAFDKAEWIKLLEIALVVNHLPSVVLACTQLNTKLPIALLRQALVDKRETLDSALRAYIMNLLNKGLPYALSEYKSYTTRCGQYKKYLVRNHATLTRILKTEPHDKQNEAITIINKQADIINTIVKLSLPDEPKYIQKVPILQAPQSSCIIS